MLRLNILVRIGREALNLQPIPPSLTFMEVEFILVVSEVRLPLSPMDHPALNLLFLPEAWSHRIINS